MGRLRRRSVEDSAPLMGPTGEPATSGFSKIFKWGIILSISLLLAGGALTGILLVTVFNVCPHQHSTDVSIITCNNASSAPSHGTQCNLTCLQGTVPEGGLHSTCGWLGKWSHQALTCTTPGLMVAGYTYEGESTKSIAEIFPSSLLRDEVYQDPPSMLQGAVSGFFDGSPMICGGLDLNTKKFVAECSILTKDNKWTTSAPLLKEIYLASGVMTNEGRSFWVLGGVDSTKNIQRSTMVLHDHNCGHNKWIKGPDMETFRVGHCSANVRSSSMVMVTGGTDSKQSLATVEMYDWKSSQWSKFNPLNHAREGHSCTSVFTNDEGFVQLYPTTHSILTVVVAGGYSINGAVKTPLSSVEMLVRDEWKFLAPLPQLMTGRMVLPSGLIWRPGTGLQLAGGCRKNDTDHTAVCSNLVWTLEATVLRPKRKWVARIGETLDKMIMPGNTALVIPNNFLRTPKPVPITTTEASYMTPTTQINDRTATDFTEDPSMTPNNQINDRTATDFTEEPSMTPTTQITNGTAADSREGTHMTPSTSQTRGGNIQKSMESSRRVLSLKISDEMSNETVRYNSLTKESTDDVAYPVLPGPDFDDKWQAPLKMAMLMRLHSMNFKAIDIDEDEYEDNNFGHFSQDEYIPHENNTKNITE